MRIAFITAGAGGMICGNCLRDNALARAFIDQGHQVQLIPTYTPTQTDDENVSLEQVFYGGINVYLQHRWALFRHTPRFFDRLWDSPALLRWVSRFAVKTQPESLGALTVAVLQGIDGPQRKELLRLIDWLESFKPDVVHLTNSMLAGMVPVIKDRLGVPVCCSLQGEDFFLSHLPNPYREVACGLLKKLAVSVDAFIAPCRDHALAMAPLLGRSASQLEIVLPGVDSKDFTSRPTNHNPGEFVIGYLARIAPEKGLHLLAEAVHHVREARGVGAPRCRLLAGGWLGAEHRPYLEEVLRRVRGWGFVEDFEYLGSIDRPAKLRLLSRLDVLSVPVCYRAPKGQYVLEALASGVPVVQPRVGIFPELLEATGGGWLFEPESVEDLAQQLLHVIDKRQESLQAARQAQQLVRERFHTSNMAKVTLDIYKKIQNN